MTKDLQPEHVQEILHDHGLHRCHVFVCVSFQHLLKVKLSERQSSLEEKVSKRQSSLEEKVTQKQSVMEASLETGKGSLSQAGYFR